MCLVKLSLESLLSTKERMNKFTQSADQMMQTLHNLIDSFVYPIAKDKTRDISALHAPLRGILIAFFFEAIKHMSIEKRHLFLTRDFEEALDFVKANAQTLLDGVLKVDVTGIRRLLRSSAEIGKKKKDEVYSYATKLGIPHLPPEAVKAILEGEELKVFSPKISAI